MKNRKCAKCKRFYCGGSLIASDWPYWERGDDRLICPECQGIDVVKEMEETIRKMTPNT